MTTDRTEQTKQTRLNQTDLKAIEARVQAEMSMLGPPPTLESVKDEGHRENRALNNVLDFISGSGRVMTLIIAETIQSGAALIIGVVFAILEYWRVLHGAEALGQQADQAALIAFAVVTANVVHPIYALRQLRGHDTHDITRMTGRGYAMLFWRKLTGKPSVESVDWSYNPVLDVAAMVITWTTVFLAVYDLIAPILTTILEGTASKPGLILVIELLMGFGLSLAGVFFLQAAAHEIGVRTLTDQPARIADIVEQRRAEYNARLVDIRERISADHMAGKIADEQRATDVRKGKAEQPALPFDTGSYPATPAETAYTAPMPTANGHTANGNGNGHKA